MSSQIESAKLACNTGVKATPVLLDTPDYLRKIYWWAYEHPLAVKFWDCDFLINYVLLGNYNRLGDAVLDEFPKPLTGSTLMNSAAYGKLIPRLQQQLGEDGRLDVIDILNVQLENVKRKLKLPDSRISLIQCDATALNCADAVYDRVLVFFLPHELPEEMKRASMAEAFRVVKPGGQVVCVEFHKPKWWHPLRWYQRLVFRLFEPFAADMWCHEIGYWLPKGLTYSISSKTTYFGGLYQKVVFRKEA